MDPWLEDPAIFPDFHTRLLNHISELLNAVLPPPYYAGVSTRVWMEESERQVEPDVDILRPTNGATPARPGNSAQAGAATALLEIVAKLPNDPNTEEFVEIFAAPGGEKLIASIEVLSPSNKTPGSGGRDLYRAKQQELFLTDVHQIEIDLLRRGTHTTLVPLAALRQQAGEYDYHACVHRADRPNSFFIAPIKLSDRLPTLPIPLGPEVPPATIDLQTAVDRSYDAGMYPRRVRYTRPCDPPLTDEQRQWAESILRQKGLLP
jgi:hypothetical protein